MKTLRRAVQLNLDEEDCYFGICLNISKSQKGFPKCGCNAPAMGIIMVDLPPRCLALPHYFGLSSLESEGSRICAVRAILKNFHSIDVRKKIKSSRIPTQVVRWVV